MSCLYDFYKELYMILIHRTSMVQNYVFYKVTYMILLRSTIIT